MKKIDFKQILPHLIAIVAFVIIAAVFNKPALEGKVLQQSDNTSWKAMYEDQRLYQEKYGHLPLWSNGMFSGMPGYQIAMKSENPVSIGFIYHMLTLWTPKPIHFFVLAALCFYLLTLVLRINPYIGILGALSYAFATYNTIIVAVGHDTKMLAIAYIPALVGSVILIYEKRYLLGTALSALFAALMIGANHPQISYYTIIILAAMTIGYLVNWIRQKEFAHIAKALTFALGAAIIGVMCNAVVLATTYEYSKESIRGGSVLADEKSNFNKTGLNKDYALSYSFYKSEPLVMMFPRLYGGSTGNLEVTEDKSKAIAALQEMPQGLAQQIQGYLQFYWGGIQQGTSGPPYSGAIICFLAILGLTVVPNKHKWWMIAASALAFMMSWGHYFDGFNGFLLDHLPMYNKFRAPSMTMVIPTFLFAFSAVVAINHLLFEKQEGDFISKYKKGIFATLGIFFVGLLVYFTADFKTVADEELIKQVSQLPDAQQKEVILPAVRNFVEGMKQDRQSLLLGDLFRSLLFVLVAAIAIWLYLRKQIKSALALSVVAIASLIDLLSIDSKYLNENNYQEAEESAQMFLPQPYNTEIAKDTGYYRVFDLTSGVNGAFNGNVMASVFHHSIGGYHAAKLSIYQDLIEKQLYKFPNCMPVVNMLNTKYLIFSDPNSGERKIQINPDAAGPVWFVNQVSTEKDPSKVMGKLDSLDIHQLAILEEEMKERITATPGDSIWLVSNINDEVNYKSSSAAGRFAVFSEVFYKKGWKAYVDGKESPIFKTNYVLRGLYVPAGKHDIRFEFRPSSYYDSRKLEWVASGLIWVLLGLSGFQAYKSSKKDD